MRLLNEGFYGKVYLAEQNGIEYAVKVSANTRSNRDEIAILRLLTITDQHPSIVQFYETDLLDGKLVLVMNYAKGYDLEYLLELLTDNDIKIIATELWSALAFIHQQGVAHRDLKLENIIYSPKHQKVCLVDFGLACSDRVGTWSPRDRKGTLIYWPPEFKLPRQYRRNNVDFSYKVTLAGFQQGDIFASGLIIYELLMGMAFSLLTPYSDDQLEDMYDHPDVPYPFPGGVCLDPQHFLTPLLRQALSPDPQFRSSALTLWKQMS